MGQIALSELSQYSQYFVGNTAVHGKFIPPRESTEQGEKVKGGSFTVTEEVRQVHYQDHLEGKEGLGLVPIDSNNNVRFSVIDVDEYKELPFMMYQSIINEFELPFCLFKSKSGGLHIYVFFTEDVKASNVVDIMKGWIGLFGLPEKTELFPKQKRLRSGGSGNWINLPYFGDTRKMLNSEGKEVGLREALTIIKSNALNLEQLKLVSDGMPLADGPPCLQSIYIRNDPLMAEMYLFNLAVYLKGAKPNTWEEEIFQANLRLDEPLPERRVEGQVISAHGKNTYSYKCNEEPICSRCNKVICESRAFGKGGSEISNFSFEQLSQILSDPPHYKWTVNGADMLFYTEQELRNQERFADYCMRYLHIVPNRLKPVRWNAILAKAFSDLEQIKMDIKDDMSPGAILGDYFYEFVCERSLAKNKMQLKNMGRVYFDEDKATYYFKKADLTHFIVHVKNFRYFGLTEIQDKITKFGAGPDRLYINKNAGSARVWSITKENMNKLSEGSGTYETEIDYSQYREEQF